jgi:hypothetical protein
MEDDKNEIGSMTPELREHVLETVMYRKVKYHALGLNLQAKNKQLKYSQCIDCAFDDLLISECQRNIGKAVRDYTTAAYCITHNNPHHQPLYWVEDSKLEETVVNLIVKRMESK